MNDEAVKFGQMLRKQRESKNLTLSELGQLANLSQPYLSQIENGKRGIPSPQVLQALAGPLGLDAFELFCEGYNMVTLPEGVGVEAVFELTDLADLFTQPFALTYKGRVLTTRDKRRVRDMLDVLLQD
jgi:transcriptional regulator with XRE-family HTH domain